MALKKYKLGKLIELVEETNSEGMYGPEDVRGINNLKEMMKTKADLNGRDLSKFQIVRPGSFVFNHRTSRNGSKFSITYNYDSQPRIFTEDYVVFRIKEDSEDVLLKEWLYMYFCRAEFDRFVITNSWGSSTEFYNWQDLCDIDITLPSISQQRKYAQVYLALQNNLAAYQSKVEELKLVCDGYLDQLKVKSEKMKVGDFIEQCDERNTNGEYGVEAVTGISTEKTFIDTKANMNGISLDSYKVVKKDTFVYVPDTSRRGDKMAIALNRDDKPLLVSSIYTTFRSKDKQKLLPEYLFMFFDRPEFDRYARFNSWGSAREVFTMDDMNDVEIPIPDIAVQQEIVNIHKCYIERQRIATQLKEQLNNLCPILIKGSLETSKSRQENV